MTERRCTKCGQKISARARDNASGLCAGCANMKRATTAADRREQALKLEIRTLQAQYHDALGKAEELETTQRWLERIRAGISSTYTIRPREGTNTSEATPFLIASDWHSEEIVKPSQVNNLNEFNLDICKQRVDRFFSCGLRLIRLLNQDVKIHNVVLALLGDFITGQIHGAENAESNALTPVEAIKVAAHHITSGFEFLLNHSRYKYIVPCKVGNHSRTTLKVRSASETGHSLETLMYVLLAAHFRNEPRIKFVIEDGYHTYIDVYDQVVRLHHGHAIKYQGGIGGLFIPAYKAVQAWQKARKADLDVFGHFHQTKDGGNFLCNGSLIGYNSFALRIKADFEPPKQLLFLMDKKRGRTATWPVLLS